MESNIKDKVMLWRDMVRVELKGTNIKLPIVLTIIDVESKGEQTVFNHCLPPNPEQYESSYESNSHPKGPVQETLQSLCSWGLMQIRGKESRDLGFGRKYMADLCAYPALNILYGVKKLSILYNKGITGSKDLLREYLGSSGVIYSADDGIPTNLGYSNKDNPLEWYRCNPKKLDRAYRRMEEYK